MIPITNQLIIVTRDMIEFKDEFIALTTALGIGIVPNIFVGCDMLM